ncbi:MAG: hypothetical protein JWM85_2347 [Acidimicrobiaceae bacterium]|nr:hypothetical protein [Acidimicrobiaceae bacterium]
MATIRPDAPSLEEVRKEHEALASELRLAIETLAPTVARARTLIGRYEAAWNAEEATWEPDKWVQFGEDAFYERSGRALVGDLTSQLVNLVETIEEDDDVQAPTAPDDAEALTGERGKSEQENAKLYETVGRLEDTADAEADVSAPGTDFQRSMRVGRWLVTALREEGDDEEADGAEKILDVLAEMHAKASDKDKLDATPAEAKDVPLDEAALNARIMRRRIEEVTQRQRGAASTIGRALGIVSELFNELWWVYTGDEGAFEKDRKAVERHLSRALGRVMAPTEEALEYMRGRAEDLEAEGTSTE